MSELVSDTFFFTLKVTLKLIYFKDEVNYALGNIIQNSILYSKVEIKISLKVNKSVFTIKIEDDGDGFSRDVLDKRCEPYISKNKKRMGLGIFI